MWKIVYRGIRDGIKWVSYHYQFYRIARLLHIAQTKGININVSHHCGWKANCEPSTVMSIVKSHHEECPLREKGGKDDKRHTNSS